MFHNSIHCIWFNDVVCIDSNVLLIIVNSHCDTLISMDIEISLEMQRKTILKHTTDIFFNLQLGHSCV